MLSPIRSPPGGESHVSPPGQQLRQSNDRKYLKYLKMSKLREPPGAGRSVFDLSVSTSPPATSEGPGPLRTKQKQNAFLPLEGPGGPDRATLGGDAASRVTG